MTFTELSKNASPNQDRGLPSLARTITAALAGRSARFCVRYNGVSNLLPTVRATLPEIGVCPDTSTEIQAELHSWLSLAMAHRLPVLEIDMPMTTWEPENEIGAEPMPASEIASLRHDLARVFQKSGRLMDDGDYVDLFLRVGIRSGAPLVEILTFSAERPNRWEDLQVYGLLTDWVAQHRTWFAGVETLGLMMSVAANDLIRST